MVMISLLDIVCVELGVSLPGKAGLKTRLYGIVDRDSRDNLLRPLRGTP